jgi:hypothetical protein
MIGDHSQIIHNLPCSQLERAYKAAENLIDHKVQHQRRKNKLAWVALENK